MYGTDHNIPTSETMNLTKFEDAVITLDACYTARLTSTMTVDTIEDVIEETKQLPEKNTNRQFFARIVTTISGMVGLVLVTNACENI